MKLKSFGCSFIFGTDLADASDGSTTLDIQASQHTWPAVLARQMKLDYECHARAGAGNLQILEQVLNQACQNQNDFFVVGWSWIDRFDCFDAHLPDTAYTAWKTIRPGNQDLTAKVYYKNMHSEYQDKLINLIWIRTAIEFLQQRKIPFVMTYADRLLLDPRWNTSPAVQQLQKEIEPYMTLFDGLTFLEWSRSNGHAESANWHPLESAHAGAADIMQEVFRKQNKDGLEQQALF
jgi:hypothetical protein